MFDEKKDLATEFYRFFLKIFIPAFIAISIKLATKMKHEKISFIQIAISFITGIGCAYFVYPFIDSIDASYVPLIVALVAMTGDRIASYLVYKFNVDAIIEILIDILIEKFRKK